jgi:hypothetical protein
MTDSMKWTLVIGAILLLWALIHQLYNILRLRSTVRFREWLHVEILAAINKGVSDQELFSAQASGTSENKFGIELYRRVLHASAAKILSLTGIVLTFGGGGLMAALKLINNRSAEFWSIGLFPCILGAGLILFALMLRKYASH